MLRLTKRFGWLGLLAASVGVAGAFSLYGPINEPYQVLDNGFNYPGDQGAPKNLGEEYRRNIPVMYYAFDQSFLDYFGSNGVAAVDAAFAILNSLTNVSAYSPDLSEFPLESRRVNYRAGVLGLLDLKSLTLSLMAEQIGLAEPVRFTWNVHDRYHDGNAPACPLGMEYLVVKRNFGIVPSTPDQVQYSSYVNGVLYSYYIQEYCQNPPPGFGLSEAVEFPVDPLASTFGAVAEFSINVLDLGAFYTGLTRDDVAGLRYMLRAGNVNWETTPSDSLLVLTNTSPAGQQLLISSNLAQFVQQSYTNDDATLVGLYPGLVIASATPVFTNVVTTNVNAYYTNLPWSLSTDPASLVLATNYDTNVATVYMRSFANVITNQYFTNSFVTVMVTNITNSAWSLPGALTTNVSFTVQTITNQISGDFFIIPTNACGLELVRTQLTRLVSFTNTPVASTNAVAVTTTNATGGTNGQQFSISYVTYFTNHAYVINPVQCLTNAIMLRRGVEKLTFVRHDYDSLLGQFFSPVTNYYTTVAVTNNTNWVQTFQRIATQPDFLFTARDGVAAPAALPTIAQVTRNITFNSTNSLPGIYGPGTIDPVTQFAFNKSGPVYENLSPGNLDELTALQRELLGSFDETTNAPVVYPNGTSIELLENQIIMQVTSTSLPPAKVSVAYSTTLTGKGGQPPYTWTLAPNSAGLPPGLLLDPGGAISGTPTADGVYDFVVRMTEMAGRYVERDLTLTITR